jgi:hypothetical protein
MFSPDFLTLFVVAQLAFDVALLLLVVLIATRRRTPPREAPPPDWYGQLLGLTQDLLAATDPILDELERRPAPRGVPDGDGDGPGSRHREAMALLRAGVDPDEVARRGRLLPGELKLIRNVVAAEALSAASDDARA